MTTRSRHHIHTPLSTTSALAGSARDTITTTQASVTGAYPNTYTVAASGPIPISGLAIDANGDIGGSSSDATGTDILTQAAGNAAPVLAPVSQAAEELAIAGIDATGAVYGAYDVEDLAAGTDTTYSVKDSDGVITPIAGPNGVANTDVLSVSPGGSATGTYKDANGAQQDFIEIGGTAMPIAVQASGGQVASTSVASVTPIDAAGEVAGVYIGTDGAYHAFITSGSTGQATALLNVPATTNPYGLGIRAVSGGAVTGYYQDPTTNQGAAFYATASAGPQTIPGPSDIVSGGRPSVVGFDAAGNVVGTYPDATGATQSFSYDPATRTSTRLVVSATATSTTVTGTDGAGDLFGTYTDATGTHDFVDQGGNVTTVPAPAGATQSTATGVDTDGDVVGSFQSPSAFGGFIDRAGSGTSTPVSVPGQPAPNLTYVDALGQIVGTVRDATGTSAFVATPGSVSTFEGASGAAETVAQASDSAGDAAGFYDDAQDQRHVFLRTENGTVTRLDPATATTSSFVGIDPGGTVAFDYTDASGPHGALYANGTTTLVSGSATATSTTLDAIDPAGDVVGTDTDATGTHVFLRSAGGTTTQLDPSGATPAVAAYAGSNAAGDVVGTYQDAGGDTQVFVEVGAR